MTPLTLRLRELREIMGLTQRELAQAAKVREATISRIERHGAQTIDLDVLDRLAAALEVDPGLMLVRTPERGQGKR